MTIFLILYALNILFAVKTAEKIGSSKIIAVGASVAMPFISVIIYCFLNYEYNKKGSAKFTLK